MNDTERRLSIIRRSLAQWAKSLTEKIEKMPKPFQHKLFNAREGLEAIYARLGSGEAFTDQDMNIMRSTVDGYSVAIREYEKLYD